MEKKQVYTVRNSRIRHTNEFEHFVFTIIPCAYWYERQLCVLLAYRKESEEIERKKHSSQFVLAFHQNRKVKPSSSCVRLFQCATLIDGGVRVNQNRGVCDRRSSQNNSQTHLERKPKTTQVQFYSTFKLLCFFLSLSSSVDLVHVQCQIDLWRILVERIDDADNNIDLMYSAYIPLVYDRKIKALEACVMHIIVIITCEY